MPAVRLEDRTLRVAGAIHMANAAAVLAEGNALLDQAVLVDLSEVTEVDSSAISLLLEWQRQASRRGNTLRFANLPDSMNSLATLYGVRDLFSQ